MTDKPICPLCKEQLLGFQQRDPLLWICAMCRKWFNGELNFSTEGFAFGAPSASRRTVSLRQNGVGPNKTCADAILPKGHGGALLKGSTGNDPSDIESLFHRGFTTQKAPQRLIENSIICR